MKQKEQFQGGTWPEKSQLDQIHNGRLEAIIDLDLGNIEKTVPDH